MEADDKKKIMPVVLRFSDDGRPMSAQMESIEAGIADSIVEVLVQQWHRSVTARGLDADRTHQAVIAMIVYALHQSDSTTAVPLQMQCDVDTQKWWAVATEDIAENELVLFPCCPCAKQFPKTSTNIAAVVL